VDPKTSEESSVRHETGIPQPVHLIGVGGAGMSGIAAVLAKLGVAVTGSDLKASRYTRHLEECGVPVHIGHDAAQVGRLLVVDLGEDNLDAVFRRQFLELVPMLGEQGRYAIESGLEDILDRLIDPPSRVLGVVLVLGDFLAYEDRLLFLAIGYGPHLVGHAPLADHLAREIGSLPDILGRACGRLAVDESLCGEPAVHDGYAILEPCPGSGIHVLLG